MDEELQLVPVFLLWYIFVAFNYFTDKGTGDSEDKEKPPPSEEENIQTLKIEIPALGIKAEIGEVSTPPPEPPEEPVEEVGDVEE